MNTSLNPFINAGGALSGGLDDSYNIEPIMHQQIHQFGQTTSTPGTVPNTAPGTGLQTIYVQTPTPMSDKIIKKFSGYMHEDGPRFLKEFESYLTLSGIDFQPHNEQRVIAAFHLHLKGPALTWFHTLPSGHSWNNIKDAFSKEYGNNANDPRLISEAAAFDNLRLNTGQAIEEFHAIVLEKGTRLNKTDRDMTNKFINGLPSQLAFFVRAGRINNFREALHSAKIGEAHGYRIHTQTPSCVPTPSATSYAPVNAALPPSPGATGDRKTYRGQKPPRTCFSCRGVGHIKSRCNWNNQGSPDPNQTCQLCFQKGHIAPYCKQHSQRSAEICQLCNTSGHTARDCGNLNTQSLGPTPTSQA